MPVPVHPAHSVDLGRDRAIDLVRALCVTAVVVLHALMVGVTVTADGPLFANAAEAGTWLTPVSWVLQVMPLFFVIGGYAGLTAHRRMRERGLSDAAFVVGRIHRLLLPATVVVGAAGIGLAVLELSGVPDALVQIAGYRFGQPLWFLAVFLLCQALLPALLRAHRAAPLGTIAVLGGAALLVDAARILSGVDAIGFLNLGFVWLTMQQLGFHLAEGRIDALSRRVRIGVAAAGAVLLALSFQTGVHSPDLVANLNPPTTALILIGVVHTCAFSLLRAPISSLANRPRVAMFTEFVSRRAMTVYLWHMPVLLTLAGVSALIAGAGLLTLPSPATADWWLGRPVWLLLALSLTALIAVPLSRVEAVRLPQATLGGFRVALAAICGSAGIVLLLVRGASTTTIPVALALTVAGLAMATLREGGVHRTGGLPP
ncbi:MAG: acyltransferase, partial [Microbacterium sp.]